MITAVAAAETLCAAVAGATVVPPTISGTGYASYVAGAHGTTLSSQMNSLSLPQSTIYVGSTSGFASSFQSLTVATSSGEEEEVFCTGTAVSTYFTGCSGGAGTMSTGGTVTDATVSSFDVATLVSGGPTQIDSASLTIVTDVPSGDREVASSTTPATNTDLVNLLVSPTASGDFNLTFGVCAPGVAVFSISNSLCVTGTIDYSPAVAQPFGDAVTVDSSTVNIYLPFSTSVTTPATVTSTTDFVQYISPAPESIPAFLPAGSLGNATVSHVSSINLIYPLPAGLSLQGVALQGGDAATSDVATAAICYTAGAGCSATSGSNYVDTTVPYIQLSVPSSTTIAGGTSVTLPTIAVSVQATGTAGTVATSTMSELELTVTGSVKVATITVGFTATGDGYPTSSTSGTPVVAAARTLASTTIVGAQTVHFGSTSPTNASVGGATYTPEATATSSLTPAITVDSSASAVCAIASGVVSFLHVGTCTLDANQAGNGAWMAAPQVQQQFTVHQGTPTASLKLSEHSIVFGREQIETFSVTVKPATGSVKPTGSVVVNAGSTTLCGFTLSNGQGSCSIGAQRLTPGTYTATAAYGGDVNFLASAPVTGGFVVAKASTKTTISLSTSSVVVGHEQVETFTVRVLPQYVGKVTGAASIKWGGVTLCTGSVVGGVATCRLPASKLSAGTYPIHGAFLGSTDFTSSSSVTHDLVVKK